MNEFNRHASAQFAFMNALERHRYELVLSMRRNALQLDRSASVRTLVRLARTDRYHRKALFAFEDAIRAPLTAYVEATPKAARAALLPEAQFLLDHFARFTEVPIAPNPIKRVVSWARRKFRGAARSAGDVD